MKLRVDKYLADMDIGSRSDIKKYIKQGLVSINGITVTSPDHKADTETDEVRYSGKNIEYIQYEYYILNKPKGIVSATKDNKDKTVLDIIRDRTRKDLFPVGRLDKDTEGLMLITNDGELAHGILSPSKHIDKTYYVETDGELLCSHVELFRKGLVVDKDFTAKEAVLDIIESDRESSKAYLTIYEGKYHQVKRMMEAVGNRVTYLKRISMGTLRLPEDLKPGEYRKLGIDEINLLKGMV